MDFENTLSNVEDTSVTDVTDAVDAIDAVDTADARDAGASSDSGSQVIIMQTPAADASADVSIMLDPPTLESSGLPLRRLSGYLPLP